MILKISNLSRLAYKGWSPDKKINDIEKLKLRVSEYIKYDDIKVQPIDDLLYFSIEIGQDVFISIRGTNCFKNWLRNCSFWKVKLKNGKVHSGFKKACDQIYERVNFKYSDNKKKCYHIGGHSFGSAVSMLLANKMYENGYNVVWNVGIGSPRVGDKKYIKNTSKYNFKRIEICNNLDIVTMLPSYLQGYRHYKMLYIEKDKELVVYDNMTSNLDKIMTFITSFNLKEFTEDHDSNVYCELLSRNVKKLKELGLE